MVLAPERKETGGRTRHSLNLHRPHRMNRRKAACRRALLVNRKILKGAACEHDPRKGGMGSLSHGSMRFRRETGIWVAFWEDGLNWKSSAGSAESFRRNQMSSVS
eukprot:2055516-Rhodomonas_salina.1